MEVTAPGFQRVSKQVESIDTQQFFRIGLGLASVGDPQSTKPDFVGEVRSCSPNSSMWVKIIGVFINISVESKVNRDCSFVFKGLPGGKYVAILSMRDAVLLTKAITITEGHRKIRLE